MTKRSKNQSLFTLETPAKPQGPVEGLGMTFENDEACNQVLRCALGVASFALRVRSY